MLVLDTTGRSLVVLLGGAVVSNQLPVIGSYVDISQTNFAVTASSAIQTVTNDASEVTLMAAPAASTSRKLEFLLIHNADTASVTVTIRYKDTVGLVNRDYSFTLAVGDILKFVDGEITVSDSNGNVKQTQGFANQSANRVFAGPTSGGAAAPTFRALVAADIPMLDNLLLNQEDLALVNGANSNIALPTKTIQYITGPSAAFNITGFVAETGRLLILYNSTAQNMTLTHNATSTAANRLWSSTGADVVLTADSSAVLVYVTTLARWLILATTA